MSSSKAAAILRRTLSGGALAGSLTLLLVWNAHSRQGAVLLASVALVLALAVFELSRMGAVRGLGLFAPLALAAAGLVGLARGTREVALDAAEARGLEQALTAAHQAHYGLDALFALLVAGAVFVLAEVFAGARWVAWLFGAALVAWVLRAPLSAEVDLRFGIVLCALLLVCGLPLVFTRGRARTLAVCLGLALWLLPPLPFLWTLAGRYGTAALVALLVISKIGDTAAYYAGSAFGKRHPFPNISPGKTEWGCIASFLTATAVAGVFHATGILPHGPFGLVGALAVGASLNLAAQAGDLFESWVKRRAGVKDSSGWFGPSGGLLDQLDSLLFSVPLAAVTWPWLLPQGS